MMTIDMAAYERDHPTWCPGCGDFGVLKALQKALANLRIAPYETVLVSGIGCSGKITTYFGGYGLHTTHGRTLPAATGIKMANRALTVIAAGGDGDGYGIGVGHLIHACRRNIDVTYIVMDNGVYGNTKGQTAPTSPLGFASSSTPYGSIDVPIAPLALAVASGATYVAQAVSSQVDLLAGLVEGGIKHPGFSLINVFSPCVTYDKARTYRWWKDHIRLAEDIGHDPHDFTQAVALLNREDLQPVGLIFQKDSPPLFERLPQFPVSPLVSLPPIAEDPYRVFSRYFEPYPAYTQ